MNRGGERLDEWQGLSSIYNISNCAVLIRWFYESEIRWRSGLI